MLFHEDPNRISREDKGYLVIEIERHAEAIEAGTGICGCGGNAPGDFFS